MTALEFPPRYEPLSRLGKGGGGEVWAVRDRHTGQRHALKVLGEDATEHEMAALVREAVTLSGLEGLGVPRVLTFGRLPRDGRPFMVRELVDGKSLAECLDERGDGSAMPGSAGSRRGASNALHRAGLLHGISKPANIIVAESGSATLVDLGLAAPWRETGTTAKGLTPKYAAPELFQGKPLTVRAEVYALGVALAETVEAFRTRARAELMRRSRPRRGTRHGCRSRGSLSVGRRIRECAPTGRERRRARSPTWSLGGGVAHRRHRGDRGPTHGRGADAC